MPSLLTEPWHWVGPATLKGKSGPYLGGPVGVVVIEPRVRSREPVVDSAIEFIGH